MESSRGAPMKDDMVTGLDACDALADADNSPRAFMAEEVGKKFVRPFGCLDLIDLSSTNAAVVETHMHLAKREMLRHLEFSNFERGIGFNKDGCKHESNG